MKPPWIYPPPGKWSGCVWSSRQNCRSPLIFFFFISCCNVVVLPLSSSSVNVHVVSLAEKSISWKKHRTQFPSQELARAKHPRLQPLHSTVSGHSQCTILSIKHPRQQDNLNYHLSRLQAAHVKEGSRIKESSLPLQQTWLHQSQITRNSLLITDPHLGNTEKTTVLIDACNTNSN